MTEFGRVGSGRPRGLYGGTRSAGEAGGLHGQTTRRATTRTLPYAHEMLCHRTRAPPSTERACTERAQTVRTSLNAAAPPAAFVAWSDVRNPARRVSASSFESVIVSSLHELGRRDPLHLTRRWKQFTVSSSSSSPPPALPPAPSAPSALARLPPPPPPSPPSAPWRGLPSFRFALIGGEAKSSGFVHVLSPVSELK